jgi:prepilin-type N-terminal cleavage/methylation domain-containing protein
MKLGTQKTFLKAFTLVELMIAITVSGVVLAGAMTFYFQMLVGHRIVDQRINQAGVIRRFSQEMVYHASRANQVFLYKSSVLADRDAVADQLHVDTTDPANFLHPAGDFVVFVYYEFPKPVALDYHRIQSIVGYYLDASGGGIGAIKKITIDLSKDITTGAATLNYQVATYDTTLLKTNVEKVMTDNWSSATHTRTDSFVLNARGLFKSETINEGFGRLFYYRDERISLMIAGQMYGTKDTSDKQTYTDSFNFSITPRS